MAWSLVPSKRVLAGETVDDCRQRTFREELGIDIEARAPIPSIRPAYTHFRTNLHALTAGKKRESRGL
jgi:hypothetical protein